VTVYAENQQNSISKVFYQFRITMPIVAHSSSSLSSTVSPFSSNSSFKFGVQQGIPTSSKKTEASYRSLNSSSAISDNETDPKQKPDSVTNSSASESRSLSFISEKPCHTASTIRTVKEGNLKTNKKFRGGIDFDFQYRNVIATSGHGRPTLGAGSGAPTGCDIM
jgi:hypothetical protein